MTQNVLNVGIVNTHYEEVIRSKENFIIVFNSIEKQAVWLLLSICIYLNEIYF